MDFLDANELAQIQMRVMEAVMLIIAVMTTISFLLSLVSIAWLCFREGKARPIAGSYLLASKLDRDRNLRAPF